MNNPTHMRQRRMEYGPLVGYLLLVGGCITCGWLLNSVIRALPTQDWPTTNGLIYEADMALTTIHPFNRQRGFFHTAIDYQYRVDGKAYRGNQVYLYDIPYLSQQAADSRLNRFTAGSVHPVAYDPKDPGNSVLLTGSPAITWNLLVPSGFFLLMGLGLSGILTRRAKSANRDD